MLSETDSKILIKLARDSIQSYFDNILPDLEIFQSNSKFNQNQGVFVTLKQKGGLRGCIGFPYPVRPLYQAIIEAAQAAAFDDSRFPPVKEKELTSIQIELSVLTIPKEIKKDLLPDDIKIGEDGLIISTNETSGLLLPQVFKEYDSTKLEALEMTCDKAGLKKDDWKDSDAKIFKFQAQIFHEK